MKSLDIRARLLLAAILPVALVAILLAIIFVADRVNDLSQAHAQRAKSLIRQVASASEYGLFSANVSSLQALAVGAMRESDVRSVVILDARGNEMVRAGRVEYIKRPELKLEGSEYRDEASQQDVSVQPVTSIPVKLDELFDTQPPPKTQAPLVLGHVVIGMSRASVVSRERQMLLAGLAVTIGGMLFGGWLAFRIGRGVIRPILGVSNMIGRISQGDLSVRLDVRANAPLHDLQTGLNQMAQRLERGRDELEQRVAEATLELRGKKEEAETATLAKSRFLAAASHDLRQPMHALGMFVARLAQLPRSDEAKALIVNLETSVQAMQDLLDALLDISRLDANSVRVHASPFPLSQLLNQLHSTLVDEALAKGLNFRVRPSALWVLSDAGLLYRILLNLVSNALRYTRNGDVLVACRLVGGGRSVRIEVWDTGVGIAPHHQEHIFKEFYQIGNAERDRSLGLGLGLNIVQRTARLLEHPLALCSRVGQGTRFSVEVPLAEPLDPAVLSQEQTVESLDDLSGLKVLVIEDDALVSLALVSLLESWGCQVSVAEGLAEAMPLMAQGLVPDVLISDYCLRGGENGMDAIERLRALAGRHLPACLLSGDTQPELMQATRLVGLTLLHKPVRPAKLRSLIRRLVEEGGPHDRRLQATSQDQGSGR